MEIKPEIETFAKIKVVGIGGGGGASLNQMIKSQIKGVKFIAVNTDIQALQYSKAEECIQIGKDITRGLGAGMNPEMGKKAAEENREEIAQSLKDCDMVFITAGLGGGTGSGAAPVIANIAREMGALTVAVVTKPFSFEGTQRKIIADKAHEDLMERVDTIITIPNDRILQIIDKKTPLTEALGIVDDVLRHGVQGIAELVTVHGYTNVDFADVKYIMKGAGSALMGIGYGKGENRSVEAAKAAIESPLLETTINGATGILFTVTGGKDLGMFELNEAARIITENASPDARIIYGTVIDESLEDAVKITVVATGFGSRGSGKQGMMDSNSSMSKSSSRDFLGVLKSSRASSVPETRQEKPKKEENKVSEKVGPFNDNLFVNKKFNQNKKEETESVNNSKYNEEEIDIPTFIRKRLDSNNK